MVSIRQKMATRSRSAVPQFRVHVPAPVLPALKGKRVLLHLSLYEGKPYIVTPRIGADVAFTLGTKDSVVVGPARQQAALEHLRKLFDLTAEEPKRLSFRDMVALSGEVYRLYIEINESNPGEPLAWRQHKALHRATLEGRIGSPPDAIPIATDSLAADALFDADDLTASIDALPKDQHNALEQRFGLLADWALIRSRIHLASEDRQRFLHLVGTASLDAGWQLRRYSEGNYSPDPKAARFPAMDTMEAAKSRQTITGMFADWWKEAKVLGRSESTHDGYKGAIDRLVAFLKHDDANRVTVDDALRFKDNRLENVSPKTVRDGDLPGLKSVFGWGVTNKKIKDNPFASITIKREKKIVVRSKGFTEDEATAIFRHCLGYERKPKEDPKTAAAKKWGPLIAAYTGCRIAEALQLRKSDIHKEGQHNALRFTPEAGSIKSGVFRVVPVHQHLVALGFIDFVKDSGDGPLFAKGSYERVVAFVREVVTDARVAPNHGWRHRLKTVTRDLGLDARVVDAIQGHAARTAGEDYGDVTLTAMYRAIAKIPRIKV